MLMSASPLHSELEFQARVIRDGRNLIFTQADAWRLNADGSRTQVASAQLTKFRLKHQW